LSGLGQGQLILLWVVDLNEAAFMQELLTEWSELQRQPHQGVQTVGSIQMRKTEEIPIVEALLSVGSSQIPGDAFDACLILEVRDRVLREMNARLSQL
jgi:hypothetical protein